MRGHTNFDEGVDRAFICSTRAYHRCVTLRATRPSAFRKACVRVVEWPARRACTPTYLVSRCPRLYASFVHALAARWPLLASRSRHRAKHESRGATIRFEDV